MSRLRPHRDDYDLCRCKEAQEAGVSECAGCEEYDVALRDWLKSHDPYAAADALADELKDEDLHRE
jgi:hypothetical protein